jgi:Pyruvate/2-oxoacid:ferredoxin oxidoreductase gamma subunit
MKKNTRVIAENNVAAFRRGVDGVEELRRRSRTETDSLLDVLIAIGE